MTRSPGVSFFLTLDLCINVCKVRYALCIDMLLQMVGLNLYNKDQNVQILKLIWKLFCVSLLRNLHFYSYVWKETNKQNTNRHLICCLFKTLTLAVNESSEARKTQKVMYNFIRLLTALYYEQQ